MSGKYPPTNRNNRYNNGNNGNNSNNTSKYRNDESNKGSGPSFVNNYDNGNGNGNGNRYDNRRPNRNNSRNENGASTGSGTGYGGNENQNSGLNINRNEIISKPDSENVDENATNATNVTNIEDNSYTPKEFDKWEDLEGIISEEIMRGIYGHGFDSPSLIQRKALLTIFDKKDIIAQAQSGTGKTGVFTIGVLQKVNTEINKTQAMILAPTRELAKQIYDVITSIGSMVKNIRFHLLIGGT